MSSQADQQQEKPKPKATIDHLAFELREINIRILEERQSRKKAGIAMVAFGALVFGFGILSAAAASTKHEQQAALAALERRPLPQQGESQASIPFVVGAAMVAYGVSKLW